MLPDSPTALYWSLHGEVACSAHAPDPCGSQWTAEGWQPVSKSRRAFEACAISVSSKEAVVALLETGSFFGEGCLNGHRRRLATAAALTRARSSV